MQNEAPLIDCAVRYLVSASQKHKWREVRCGSEQEVLMMNLTGGSKGVLLREASVLSSCQLPKENSASSVIWNLLCRIKAATSVGPRTYGKGTAAARAAVGVCLMSLEV